ncbi:hypothetical protein B0H13DRAFT_1857374 [Mycena leptocephala]|nr:hypothetical protein B0H13DRAFT_1857374 [Mycena leptocephala]
MKLPKTGQVLNGSHWSTSITGGWTPMEHETSEGPLDVIKVEGFVLWSIVSHWWSPEGQNQWDTVVSVGYQWRIGRLMEIGEGSEVGWTQLVADADHCRLMPFPLPGILLIPIVEFGSYDPGLAAFIPMQSLGSINETSCVVGFDQTSFILDSTAEVFPEFNASSHLELNDPSGLQFSARVQKSFLKAIMDGAIVPNALHGRAGFSEAHEKLLTLADGGLDGANIPLQPLLVKARGIRAITTASYHHLCHNVNCRTIYKGTVLISHTVVGYNADHCRPRERAFMCAILRMDYQRLRPAVAVHKILFMAQHPGRPFCVWFDYSQRGDSETRVISADELPALPEFEAELPMHVGSPRTCRWAHGDPHHLRESKGGCPRALVPYAIEFLKIQRRFAAHRERDPGRRKHDAG